MMVFRSALAVALVAAVAGGATASAPSVSVSTIDLGASSLYAQSDDTSVLAGIQVLVRAGLDRETSAQSGLAALAAQTILVTPVDGVALRDAIAAHGGSLTTSVGPQYVRFYLQGQPASLAGYAALLARAIAHPDTSFATLAAARRAIAAKLTDDEANPVSVGLEMVRQSYYDNGAALPVYGTTATLANQTGADVAAFVSAHYVRANAIVSAVGQVTADVQSAAKTLVAAFADAADAPVKTAVKPFGSEPREIIAQRDIGVPYLVMGFAAPSVADKDFATMLVVRALLGDVFDRPSATSLPAFSRAVGVVYTYDAQPAAFALYVNGSQLDPARGLSAVERIIGGLADKPLPDELLKRYKAIAHGEWAMENVSLADRAFAIGNFVAFGAGADSGSRVTASLDAVTGADVKRVAAAYLKKFTVALVVPRQQTKSAG